MCTTTVCAQRFCSALCPPCSSQWVAGWGAAPVCRSLSSLALAVNGFAYFFSDRIALSAMRARPVCEVEQPVLYRIVRSLSTEARRPMPRLYLSPTMQPNAFATGRNPRNAAVCVTYGLLGCSTSASYGGSSGTSSSHVYNRDILHLLGRRRRSPP